MAPASKSKNFAVESAFMNELVTLFSDSDLTTLELETDEIAVKLSRGSEGATVMMPQMAQMGQPFAAAPGAPATPAAPAVEAAPDASHPGAVKSPMVGTVYEGPEPGAPAFIKEGDTVKVKLMGFDDRGKVRLSMKVVDQETGEDLEGKAKEGDDA